MKKTLCLAVIALSLLQSTVSNESNSTQILLNAISALSEQLNTLQQRLDILHQLGSSPVHPASSCAEILEKYPDSTSGYYWVSNATKHTHNMYCDMTKLCGGVTGGWMRVAHLDMSNSSHHCPGHLVQRNTGKRSCAIKTYGPSCSSAWYLSQGMIYSRICGKVIGYRVKFSDGFFSRSSTVSIDSNYVDGVGLMYGRSNKQHIWTFAAGHDNCSCGTPPAFVGNHYFCTGQSTQKQNLLWDGENCIHSCCHSHNPPWFHRHLPHPTTEDIEMRLCRDQTRKNEDATVRAVEIFVR